MFFRPNLEHLEPQHLTGGAGPGEKEWSHLHAGHKAYPYPRWWRQRGVVGRYPVVGAVGPIGVPDSLGSELELQIKFSNHMIAKQRWEMRQNIWITMGQQKGWVLGHDMFLR